ncbi:MAG: YdcF family protein [Paracoccaceae bacterium]|nr:YdcF family protein [Paracoccaceae bacterium]
MGVIARLVWRCAKAGIVLFAVTTLAVLVMSHLNLERHGIRPGPDQPVEAILVLGGGVDPDGVPGYSSRRRVAAAVALYRAGKTQYLILSGRRSAALMRDYAVSLDVPAEAIILEPQARTTFENIRFGIAIAEERGITRMAVLTDAFHLERARRLAAYFGQANVVPIAVTGLERGKYVLRTASILREAMAWWYNLAKVAVWEALALAGFDPESRGALVR